jgi:hypothetical protein
MEVELLSFSLISTQLGPQSYLYAGLLLVGCSAVLLSFLYVRLRDVGRRYIAFKLPIQLISDYLRLRPQYGWSPWPAYLVWPAAIAGWVLFFVGLTKL